MKAREVSWTGEEQPDQEKPDMYQELERKFETALAISYVAIGITAVMAIWVTYVLTTCGLIRPSL